MMRTESFNTKRITLIPSVKSVIFRIRTCENARVLLSTAVNDISSYYAIHLGYSLNMHSYIKNLNTDATLTTVDTPYLLDCNQYRSFW